MAKKINHRGHGGHRELLFSLCPLCSLWFSEPIPEDNKKSQITPVHEAQLLSYLKLSGKRLGLLINFNVVLLKDGITRRIN
jgi:hypothetical protein